MCPSCATPRQMHRVPPGRRADHHRSFDDCRAISLAATRSNATTQDRVGRVRFPNRALVLTEASPKKRASLHLVQGEDALAAHDLQGLEVLAADLTAFRKALRRENHTLKRALTDPRLFSGVGNAYSDEILHAARLSPIALTSKLTDQDVVRLYAATRETLERWVAILRAQFADHFPGPGEITAFREGFAVHGRFRRPCPVCGRAVQRIRYAQNETNYCHPAKPVADSWPTGRCRACSRTTGRIRLTNSNRRQAARARSSVSGLGSVARRRPMTRITGHRERGGCR